MRKLGFVQVVLLIVATTAGPTASHGQQATNADASLALPSEKHLRNVRQLTFGGQNAEAYFAADDRYLIF